METDGLPHDLPTTPGLGRMVGGEDRLDKVSRKANFALTINTGSSNPTSRGVSFASPFLVTFAL